MSATGWFDTHPGVAAFGGMDAYHAALRRGEEPDVAVREFDDAVSRAVALDLLEPEQDPPEEPEEPEEDEPEP